MIFLFTSDQHISRYDFFVHICFQCVRILADFLQNRGRKDPAIVEMLEQTLKSSTFSEYFLLIAATIYMHLQVRVYQVLPLTSFQKCPNLPHK